jgi:hypothetical protein
MINIIEGNILAKHKLDPTPQRFALRNEALGYRVGIVFVIFIIGFMAAGSVFGKETGYEAYSNLNTVALWLFDEPNQPGIILADSSRDKYNLRLHEAGRLAPGKFGNALEILSEPNFAVSYAGITDIESAGSSDETSEENNSGSGRFWGPTEAPEEILSSLTDGNWTCEFWLKLASAPQADVMILDLGQAYQPGFTISLTSGAKALIVVNSYGAYRAQCPTDAVKLADGKWHHIALTQSKATGLVQHYLDGKTRWFPKLVSVPREPVPPVTGSRRDRRRNDSDFSDQRDDEWRREHRFNIAIGHDRKGNQHINGMIDEMRLSKINRYLANFPVPGSFFRSPDPNDVQNHQTKPDK